MDNNTSQRPPSNSPDAPARDDLTNVRVLVLDDEFSIRSLVSRSLKHCGASVEAVSDGREGLQALIDRYFDVLVVDLCMPNMDGPTFLQEALKIWPWLGVVVITGYGSPEAFRKIHDLGITRILEKPFERSTLIDNVRDEFRQKQTDVSRQQTVTLSKMQQQLQILRLITEPALQADTLMEALRSLSIELSQSLDFAVVGVFACEDDQNAAIFNIRDEVSKAFIDRLDEFFRNRYAALTGHSVPTGLRVELKGKELVDYGSDTPAVTFCVPIMTGGEVKGFLILASPNPTEYEASEVSFIYHVANHLSTVFAALSRMRSLAIHDPMTGLYNRLHLEAEVQDVWSWSERYGRPLAIVIADLDHFKMINDTYGHLVGDRVLVEFGDLLREVGRASDICGRYGGEEFVVLLTSADRADGLTYAKRLLQKVQQHVFCKDDYELHLTISIGVSIATKGKLKTGTAQEVLQEADQAMYQAKHAGRNCVRVWSPGPDDSAVQEKASGIKTAAAQQPLMQGRILIVDDEEEIRDILSLTLKRENYEVRGFGRGEEALEEVESNPGVYDLILVDIQLPGMSGLELLKKIRCVDESAICIMISGYATADNAIESLRTGAYDFIPKPCVYEQVLLTIRRAMDYRRALLENHQFQQHLSEMVRQKSARAREALREVEESYSFTLEALVGLLDARERDTGDHSKRVRALAIRLAREMRLPDGAMKDIAYGALLHDIGKIGIPDRILLKAGPLDPDETAIMQQHAEIGYRVLSGSGYLENAAEIVYSHQEAFDGNGYPRGLKGKEICPGARLFAVIDAYDAMRTNRVYRKALPEQEAVDEIRRNRGKQFDPAAVDAFQNCYEDLGRIFDEWEQQQSANTIVELPA